MAFTINNDPAAPVNAAAFEDQAEVDAVDFDILAAGFNGTGVISGCAVTAGAGANEVSVASGVVLINGQVIAVSAQANQAVTAAHGSLNRIDLVSINTSGTVVVTAGSANANACMPDIPANSAVLAAVFREAADAAIASTDITDKRVILSASSFGGSFRLGNSISPNITANQTDWAPTGIETASVIYVTSDASRTIFSMAGSAAGATPYDGQTLWIVNDNTTMGRTITLDDAAGSGTAAMKFALNYQVDLVLDSREAVCIRYHGGGSRWKVLSTVRRTPSATTSFPSSLRRQYVWYIDSADSSTYIAAANELGPIHASSEYDETVVRIVMSAKTPGTSITLQIQDNADSGTPEDMDTEVWGEVDSNSLTSAGAVVTSSFTDSSLPARTLLRCNVTAVSGNWQGVTVIMETTISPLITTTITA